MVKGISKLVMDLTVRLTCVKGKVKSDFRFDLSFAKDQICSKSNFSSRVSCGVLEERLGRHYKKTLYLTREFHLNFTRKSGISHECPWSNVAVFSGRYKKPFVNSQQVGVKYTDVHSCFTILRFLNFYKGATSIYIFS